MNNKELVKYLINNIIEREYYNLLDNFSNVLNKDAELKKEYEKYINITENIFKRLYEILPEEYHEMLDKLESASSVITGLETKAMFKEGLVLGINELNYLNEIGLEVAFA
ncbi:hypothetical protein FDC49_17970 [Clostridium sporogenes]|uniref:hypothetical protein n=1 Tax=Clostridium TaxID=1485 RepID=UPI0007734C00|nr:MULTISPECIES: hypothetical protein [Clostridium]NFH34346.1 hypothetical protein [Clostridium sporogenes]NFL21596.1 hypothetical protein [Clostridium sporogenes]NFN73476.1 hypothetical protein [Clostridium sporogenes]NFV23067.1 hypothetical protein [Clostridium sporogenes]